MFSCDKKIKIFLKNSKIKVTKSGKIFRFKNNEWKEVVPHFDIGGYLKIGKSLPVHRIVFLAINKKIDSYKIINHKDGNKTNNNISNLENISYQKNSIHARKLGKFGKITQKIADKIRSNKKYSKKELAKKYGLHIGSIQRILNGETWSDNPRTPSLKPKNQKINYDLIKEIAVDSNYKICKNGDIWTFLCKKGRTKTKKLRRVAKINSSSDKGYFDVRYKNRLLKLHRVVYYKFKGEILKGNVINHKDGNKRNNHLSNLEQMTYSENGIHASRILRKGVVKYSLKMASKIRELYRNKNISVRDLAAMFSLRKDYVWLILYNKRWKDPRYKYKRNYNL